MEIDPDGGRFDEDLGHVVRSEWERIFAEELIERGIDYEYESLRVKDGSKGEYWPDFIFRDVNIAVELKGKRWRGADTTRKAVKFREQFPGWTYIVVGAYLPSDHHFKWEDYDHAINVVQDRKEEYRNQ